MDEIHGEGFLRSDPAEGLVLVGLDDDLMSAIQSQTIHMIYERIFREGNVDGMQEIEGVGKSVVLNLLAYLARERIGERFPRIHLTCGHAPGATLRFGLMTMQEEDAAGWVFEEAADHFKL